MCQSMFRLACVLGFLAVVLGAFGAHGLEGRVDPARLETFEIGVRYHMAHALALLAVAAAYSHLAPRAARIGAGAMTLGILIFSGSLYLLTVTGMKWLGMITPIGGLAFLVGWISFAIAAKGKPAA